MRLVQVTIPTGKRDAVLATLDDEGIDYVVSDETSGREYTAVVSFPLPTRAVEPILDELRRVGIDEDAYTVILDVNTVVSRQFEALQNKYDEEVDEDRIAREELRAAAADLAPSRSTYVVMTAVSALVATAGLLLDSPAIVVGSMVIAPLIGPAMATSVGTVVGDDPLFRRGVKLQVLGLLLSIVTAAAVAFAVRNVHLIPPLADVTAVDEIRERVAPDFLSLIVALGAGVAGVISLSTGVSTALVGVMIAVALIPPAATVGIGLAWGQPLVSLGSAVLLLVNVLSINFAAMSVLWYSGYRPGRWFRLDEARAATLKRVVVLGVAIVVLSVFLGGVTLDSYNRATTEEDLREVSAEVVEPTPATLLSVEVRHTNTPVFQEPSALIVTVGVPPDEPVTGLATQIDVRADEVAGLDVATEVRYIPTEREATTPVAEGAA